MARTPHPLPRRPGSMPAVAVGSLVVLGGLVYLLSREARPPGPPAAGRPLVVYCAAALKQVMEATAAEYARETGRAVEFRFGNSESVLASAVFARDGDLFLPADDSYVRLAEDRGIVAAVVRLARMRAVVLTRSGNPHRIAAFDDLLKDGLKLGQANPDAAAVARVTRDHLRRLGRWDALAARTVVFHTTVTEAANAVKLGGNDAAIVWDAVAANYPDLAVVRLPELAGATGRVELAVLATAPDPAAAARFARYVAAGDRGLSQFRRCGFTDLEPGGPWEDRP